MSSTVQIIGIAVIILILGFVHVNLQIEKARCKKNAYEAAKQDDSEQAKCFAQLGIKACHLEYLILGITALIISQILF